MDVEVLKIDLILGPVKASVCDIHKDPQNLVDLCCPQFSAFVQRAIDVVVAFAKV